MKLLVILNHFLPDRGGGGAVYTDMCVGLAERGVDVTVFCPYPFYPEWKDKSGRNGLRFWRYEHDRVKVTRYGFFIPKNPRSIVQRIAFEATLLLSLLRLVPSVRQFDAVMVYCPYFSAVVAAGVAKLLFGKPLWLNVQDVASDAVLSTGMVRPGTFAKLFAAVERFLFNRADIWSSISPVMITRLARMRRRDQPILFLPNWVDAELSTALAAQAPAASVGSRVRLLYAGNIGGKQDLLGFCKTLQASSAPFEFRIFGNGGAAEEVKAWVNSIADERFSFGAFLGAEDLARELRHADFYVITERQNSGASFFPSKYVTSLAAGTPILAVCDKTGPLGEEMQAAETGPRFDWDQLGGIADLLTQSSNLDDRISHWRQNALRRARDFDRDLIIDRVQAQLNQIVAGKHVGTSVALGEIEGQAP